MLLSAVRLARAALRLQPCRACSSWGSRSQCSSADPACHPRCRNMQLFSASLAMQRCSDHRWSCSKCNFQNKSSCSARAAATQPLLQWHCPCCTGTAILQRHIHCCSSRARVAAVDRMLQLHSHVVAAQPVLQLHTRLPRAQPLLQWHSSCISITVRVAAAQPALQ